MAIYTRWGSAVTVVTSDPEAGKATLRRAHDGALFHDVDVANLTADRGWSEIEYALQRAAHRRPGARAGA